MADDEPLINISPKSCREKLLWERLRTDELKKEVKSLRHEVGVLTSELQELNYLMKTEEVGALILKNKAYNKQIMSLVEKNKALMKENERLLIELIKLKNK